MKKIYLFLLILIALMTSVESEAGVLKKFDYTIYDHLFPDSLKNTVFIEKLDTNFTYVHATIGSYKYFDSLGVYKDSLGNFYNVKYYYINKYFFQDKPSDGKVKINMGDTIVECILDSIYNVTPLRYGWYSYLLPDQNGFRYFYHINKSLLKKVPLEFTEKVRIKIGIDKFMDSTAKLNLIDIFINKDDEVYGRAILEKFSSSVFCKYSNNKWEIIMDSNNTLTYFYNYYFTDDNRLIYSLYNAVGVFDLNTGEDKKLFLFNELIGANTVLSNAQPNKSSIFYNSITDEIISIQKESKIISIYNINSGNYKFIHNELIKSVKILSQKDYKLYIDKKGTLFFVMQAGYKDDLYLLVYETNGKVTSIELPLEVIEIYSNAKFVSSFLTDDNKIYFSNNGGRANNAERKLVMYVYDHYTSDIEDDFHNKSLVFESPYPNPVGVESKVSGKFFAMPYLIKGLTMDLFDINGRKILDLSGNVNYNPATGLGNYSFSTLGLPRGMYYLIFNSSIYKDSKNIIVK